MTAPYLSPDDIPAPAASRPWSQLYNRANASSARLIGKGEGLLGRAATALHAKSIGDFLSQRRDQWFDEAASYDEAAGPARTTAERVASVVGSLAPELGAYASVGGLFGAAAEGVGLAARIARGTVAALPVTAALEADRQEGSTAYELGKVLGSERLTKLSESPLGRVAVGSAVDLAGNTVAEGLGSAIKRGRAWWATRRGGSLAQGAATVAQDASETTIAAGAPLAPSAAHATEGAGGDLAFARQWGEQDARAGLAAENPFLAGTPQSAAYVEAQAIKTKAPPASLRAPSRLARGPAPSMSSALGSHAAMSGVGALTGANVGETPEERRANAGLGAVAGLGISVAATHLAPHLARSAPVSLAGLEDPAVQRILAGINGAAPKAVERMDLGEMIHEVHRQVFNARAPLEDYSAKVLGGKSLTAEAARASGWEESADVRLKTSFRDVVQSAKGWEPQVRALTIAERALELARNDLPNKGVDLGAAEQAVKTLSAIPEVRAAADNVKGYYRTLLDRRLDNGLISKADYDSIVAKGEHYVPFVRDMLERDNAAGKGSRGLMQTGSGVRTMSEGEATSAIRDPLRQAIADTYETERAVARQRVTRLIVEGLDKHPEAAAPFIREVASDTRPRGGSQIVSINVAGAKRTFEVEKTFGEAWAGLAPQSLDLALRFLGTVKNVQRAGVTLAPIFTIRNAARDAIFSGLQQPMTRARLGLSALGGVLGANADEEHPAAGAVMGMGMGAFAGHGANVLTSLGHILSHEMGFKALGQPEIYREWLREGGGAFGYFPKTQKETAEMYRRLSVTSGPAQLLNPKSWLHGLETINRAVEAAPRIAEYKRLKAAGVSIPEAVLGSREITVDFSKGGSATSVRVMNQITPFASAKLAGWDRAFSLLRKPETHAKALALITAPTVALWSINRASPSYQALPEWQKMGFWAVPKGEEGEGFWLIPRPHEVAAIYAALPEALLNWADQKGYIGDGPVERVPSSLSGSLKQIARNVGIDGTPEAPGLFKPMLEAAANYDTYTGRPIVPESLERLPSELQYDDQTSSLGRGIGALTGTSPKMADHMLGGYTGSTGRLANHALSTAARQVGLDDRGPSPFDRSQGVFGGLSSNPLTTPAPATEVFDRARQADGIKQGIQHLIDSQLFDQLPGYLEKYGPGMGEGQLVSTIADNLRQLARAELLVERDRSMSREEKERSIREIRRAQYELAKLTSGH
jgi:hypothetical protein